VTLIPPAGAGPLRFTLFNVVEVPPPTLAGERPTDTSAIGVTVSVAVLLTLFNVAVIVIEVVEETAEVVIVNAADAVAPAATVTEAGTPTPGSLLLKLTLTPPAGAGPVKFTLFNVVEPPPPIVAGESATESNASGFTVRIAVLPTPFKVAVIVIGVAAETAEVVIVK